MSRYTRLEQAAMDALAHDLRAEIPSLTSQFEKSRPNQRRNSGFGLFTEVIVDQTDAEPPEGPTGDLGSVHVMVGNLPDPIAFKARVRRGVLLGLLGDSYGQDTRAIDFSTVPFDQVFTVDARGRSVPFHSTNGMPVGELPIPGRYSRQEPVPRLAETSSPRDVAPLHRVPTLDIPIRKAALTDRVHPPTLEPAPARLPTDPASLLIGLWILIGAVALLTVAAFRLPVTLAIVFAAVAGRAVKNPRVLESIGRTVDG